MYRKIAKISRASFLCKIKLLNKTKDVFVFRGFQNNIERMGNQVLKMLIERNSFISSVSVKKFDTYTFAIKQSKKLSCGIPNCSLIIQWEYFRAIILDHLKIKYEII